MKIALFVLLAAATAHAGTTFQCDYDWDISHEYGIIIQEGQAIESDGVYTKSFDAEVGFYHPTRVALPQPIAYEHEVLQESQMHTRLGVDYDYSIDLTNGAKLDFSYNDHYGNDSIPSSYAGTYTDTSGNEVNVSCSLSR